MAHQAPTGRGDTPPAAPPDSRPVSLVYTVPSLRGPAEILLDPWGVPHIYASCPEDAFFAQGFNAARDRLWQLDLWRRQGLGLLSEVLGPGYLARDRAARLFLYRGPMEDEWSSYGCDLKAVITPFVEGINEYVRLTAARPGLLPPEFRALGFQPATWQPEDVLRIRGHGRYRNVHSEVARAMILHEFGPAAEALRVLLEPDTRLVIPEGLDLSLITTGILRDYDLATTPAEPLHQGGVGGGSNNWVISGRRTASGRPILANDPHRALSVPSLRYLVHLACPGMNVIGGGEPVLPGISIGHNGRLAFGLTVLPVDQEDLYVYETDTAGGSRYRYQGDWEQMEITTETVPVRGAEPAEVELKFTRHGPVVHEMPGRRAAFSVRAAWLQPGMVPYLAGIGLMRAGDWDEFRTAAHGWGAPGENLIYADVDGNIAWQPAARVPVRRNWDGLLPVPGDGRFEWDGFVTPADLPTQVNPDCGWLATANQYNVPADQVAGVHVGFEWESPFRYRRIKEALSEERPLSLQDSAALQNDYFSLVARQLTAVVRGLPCRDPRASSALALLAGWDCRMDSGSAAAALFEVWFRLHLRPALFTDALAGHVPAGKLGGALAMLVNDANATGDARIDLALIERARGSPAASRRLGAIIETSLAGAMRQLEDLLGQDTGAWEWGALHRAELGHPFLPEASRPGGPLAPRPRGGSGDTVGNTAYGSGGFRQAIGATLRMVLDVGGWDNSLAMNAPGQSGDPGAAHYSDLLAAWARDESIPLLYSRERIEAVTRQRILLTPDAPPAPGADAGRGTRTPDDPKAP
jgi:penicillin G amidase